MRIACPAGRDDAGICKVQTVVVSSPSGLNHVGSTGSLISVDKMSRSDVSSLVLSGEE